MARTPPGSPPTPSKSKVVGKVGVALPPVEPGVHGGAEAGKGYIGYYDGGAFGIPVTSKNKEAALLFLQFIGQDSVQPDWAVAGAAHHQHRDLSTTRRSRRWTRSSAATTR